jgi:hypothetical protein
VVHKITSDICPIRNPTPFIGFQEIDSISSSFDDGGGVEKFYIEIRACKPNFSEFRFPRDLLLNEQLIQTNF